VTPPYVVPFAGDQDLRLDLAEAVEHRQRAHVGRAHGPHRAQADAGQESDGGLRHVGQDGADAIAGLHAHRLERPGQRGDLAAQLGPGDLPLLPSFVHRLVAKDDRRVARRMGAVGVAEHVRGVVELRPGKPARARHDLLGDDGRMRRRRAELEEVPHRLPEGVQVVARPAPEAVVALGGRGVEIEATRLAQEPRVAQDVRLGQRHAQVVMRARSCASTST
jgi:hypothetical protein